jgi:hypothetical protein
VRWLTDGRGGAGREGKARSGRDLLPLLPLLARVDGRVRRALIRCQQVHSHARSYPTTHSTTWAWTARRRCEPAASAGGRLAGSTWVWRTHGWWRRPPGAALTSSGTCSPGFAEGVASSCRQLAGQVLVQAKGQEAGRAPAWQLQAGASSPIHVGTGNAATRQRQALQQAQQQAHVRAWAQQAQSQRRQLGRSPGPHLQVRVHLLGQQQPVHHQLPCPRREPACRASPCPLAASLMVGHWKWAAAVCR